MNKRLPLAILALLGLVSVSTAQVSLEKFDRQLEQIQRDTRLRVDTNVPAEQRVLFDYGGYITFNFLALDDPAQKTHILRQEDLNAYARLNIDGVHDFFVRARTSYRDWNTGDAFDSHGDDWVEPTLDRGVYRFDLSRAMQANEGKTVDYNLVFEGGRQLVHWNSGLVLSDDIDGGQFTLSYNTFSLQILAGVTRDSITDFDSSRPDFDGNTHRGFYGAQFNWQVTPEHKPYIYGLVQEDYNRRDPYNIDPDGPSGAAGAIPTRFEYNTYYIGVGSNGALSDQLLYGVEFVYEGGTNLSNSFDNTGSPISQSEDDVSAGAMNGRLDYLFADANHSRLGGEMTLASGDTDRGGTSSTFFGNEPGTKDTAFNGFGLLNTGLAFAPNVSNMMLFRVGASTFPLPNSRWFNRLQVGIDGFVFNKLNANAPIDEPTSDDGYLGSEIDLYANWQITSDLSLALRYGVFFPGEAIATDHDTRNFFYTGLTFAF